MAIAQTNTGNIEIENSGIPTNYGALSTLVTVFFSGVLSLPETAFLFPFVNTILI